MSAMPVYRMTPAENVATTIGLGGGRIELDVSALVKLASVVAHVDEALGAGGHALDVVAVQALLADTELDELMQALNGLALIPVAR